MTVPDLSQFIKRDQNVQEDPSRFDFTAVELKKEVSRNEWRTSVNESSTESQRIVRVPFPRSNPAEKIHRTDKDQSESSMAGRPALMLISQSELGVRLTSDQSEVARAQLFRYKNRCHRQFVSTASLETESRTVDAANSTSRKTLSNSIDFIEDCARPPSSKLLKKVTSNLLWLVQSSRRILIRRIKPHKHQRYRPIHVFYAVISLCSSAIIAAICWYIMRSLGMGSPWCAQTLMLGMANTSKDVEPDSDD